MRTRFAPSPTGPLHLGGARTAILNFLAARQAQGVFLLRFEDTDPQRAEARWQQAIREDLMWLGLRWEEVPPASARKKRHEEALRALAEKGAAYRCFCSAEQLARDRARAKRLKLPPRYSGRCRALSPEEAEARAARGEPFVWRLAARGEGEIVVRDRLRGELSFARASLDDPALTRSDGSFTFLLPNAVDDADDRITLVLRGDDHLTNTAYQVWMLAMLGLDAPEYLHHGLIVDASGRKLSKRRGDATIAELRDAGFEPEAVVQALVRLGMPNLPEDALSLEALAAYFRPEAISSAPARWDPRALAFWNKQVLAHLAPEALAARIHKHLPERARAQAHRIAALLRENLAKAEDVRGYARLWDAHAPLDDEAKAWVRRAPWLVRALRLLDEVSDAEAWLAKLADAVGASGRALWMPLRAALLGRTDGPAIKAVAAFLGVEGVRARIEDALRQTEG